MTIPAMIAVEIDDPVAGGRRFNESREVDRRFHVLTIQRDGIEVDTPPHQEDVLRVMWVLTKIGYSRQSMPDDPDEFVIQTVLEHRPRGAVPSIAENATAVHLNAPGDDAACIPGTQSSRLMQW